VPNQPPEKFTAPGCMDRLRKFDARRRHMGFSEELGFSFLILLASFLSRIFVDVEITFLKVAQILF
jgi:hypothetical protein